MTVDADFETRSRVPIQHGTDKYSAPAEPLIYTFARDDDAAQLWDIIGGEPMPRDLDDALRDPNELFWYHNVPFDKAIMDRCMKRELPIERYRCTLALAKAHGYPGSLEALGAILELPQDERKRVEDGKLIQLFCVPHGDGTYADRESHPQQWETFCEYGLQDTRTLRTVRKKLPTHNFRNINLQTWWLDQLINERGFGFDPVLATAARALLEKAKVRHDKDMVDATDGNVESATQRQRFLDYLHAQGWMLPNLRASTVSEWLEGDDLEPRLRGLLELRAEAAKSSGAKYRRGLETVGEGNRIRYGIQFSGAGRTGRFSGKLFQAHNLPRPNTGYVDETGKRRKAPVKAKYIEQIIIPGILSGDALNEPILYGGPQEACSNALRGCIVAAPGNELVVADWSNIEGRILAWVAGEEWKLGAYRAQDAGQAVDGYKLLYSRFFGVPLEDVGDHERQIGKVIDLSCLGADTQVLTQRGYVDIVEVSDSDVLWDGIEWVNHAGLVAKGVRPVVDVDGIKVTPDHLVATRQKWLPARRIASNADTLCRALDFGSANLPSSASQQSAIKKALASMSRVRAAPPHTPSCGTIFDAANLLGAITALNARVIPRASPSATGNTRPSLRTWSIVGDFLTAWLPPLIAAITRTTARTTTTVRAALRSIQGGAMIAAPSCSMLSLSTAGITPLSSWIASTAMEAMHQVTCISAPNGRITSTAARFARYKVECSSSKPVYDIAFAGPRNRFTVKTRSGHLIVHNCGYLAGVGAFVTMAAGYEIDLDTLPPLVLPKATPEQLAKAEKAWKRAFMDGNDFDLHWETYMACDVLKQVYREANENIYDVGHKVGRACIDALRNPGTSYEVARCKIWRQGTFLIIQLPSGRRLLYMKPILHVEEIGDPLTGKKRKSEYVSYLTPRGKSVMRERAWAGLFIENIVQAIANDILRCGLIIAHEATWAVQQIRDYLELVEGAKTAISLHVHDEIVLDVPKGSYALKTLLGHLTTELLTRYDWTRGLPLAAAGWVGPRFKKI